MQTVAFPSYSKHISSFSKHLEVQLPECRTGNEPAGFQFFSVGDINCLSGLNGLYEIISPLDVDLLLRPSDNSAWLSE